METLETRLNEVARIAVRLEQETGCPAQLMIAQWAIEPVGHANYFGIKKVARHTQGCVVATREVINGETVIENLEFADYNSLDDSCSDYAWLITHGAPYRAAWKRYLRTTISMGGLRRWGISTPPIRPTPDWQPLVTTIAGHAAALEAIAHTRRNRDLSNA